MRFLVVVLGCAFVISCETESEAETEAETEAEAEAEAESEPEAEPEAESEPEAAAEAVAAYTVVPPPDTFFFVDRCFQARGATQDEALAECRRVRRRDRWTRRWCECEPERVFEASPDNATLHHGCCGAISESPSLAHKECQRRLERRWCELREGESADEVHPVWGPYTRSGPFREFDGAAFRYVALTAPSSYGWTDETGESPCFPDGTQVLLEDGTRAIEDVRVGDRVVAMDDKGELYVVRVQAAKTRRADQLVHVDLGTRTLRVTPRHPLLVNDEWVDAGEIRPGDALTTPSGRVTVRNVGYEHGPVRVHTLSVGAPHTFFADGVLAHNY